MAVAFIKGMQGNDPKYLKTVATAKHYAVHSGPEPLRHTFDAVVSDRDLRETYLPHFEAAVREGGAWSVMCAYNSVDGQPACANTRLLQDILRNEWEFQGYVVSDCGAIGDIYANHKFVATPEDGVAQAIKAGTDLNCGVEYGNVVSAVHKGLLTEFEIDQSLRRLLLARFKLGMFDPPEMVKYAQIPYSENDSPVHRQLAIEAARKSIVLLKNEGQILPLSKGVKTLAVIGANANDPEVLLANYNGIPSSSVTPLEGIRSKLGAGTRVLYARGSNLAANLPHLELIPASALFTTNGPDRQNGLTAEYFNSANFDGHLHRPRELTVPSSGQLVGEIPSNPRSLFTRIDRQVDFNWWDGAPRNDMNDDDFGVRWSGYLSAPAGGTYQLGAEAMNSFELYFEDKLFVQSSSVHGGDRRYAPIHLDAGKLYPIRLHFHEYVNEASIRLLWSPPETDLEEQALAAARQGDAVLMFLGLSPRLEGEEMQVAVEGFQGGDRVQIGLPDVQDELMAKIAALGKPLVLVLLNGSALAVNWAREHVPAIVEVWYPGQAAGAAIADVLFGDYNPAGRLPVTFYQSLDQLPPFTDYGMKGRTYRFFNGEPLFPFGCGLSYTTFTYRNLNLPAKARAGADLRVSVEVENTGKMAGEEVVQLYTKMARDGAPIRSLAGFRRVALKRGERRTVKFVLAARELASVDEKGGRAVRPGSLQIAVGGEQPGPNVRNVVTGAIQIEGPTKVVE
jgi:beta-glucosidase